MANTNSAAVFDYDFEVDEIETEAGYLGPLVVHYDVSDVTRDSFNFTMQAFTEDGVETPAAVYIDRIGLKAWNEISDMVETAARRTLLEDA